MWNCPVAVGKSGGDSNVLNERLEDGDIDGNVVGASSFIDPISCNSYGILSLFVMSQRPAGPVTGEKIYRRRCYRGCIRD